MLTPTTANIFGPEMIWIVLILVLLFGAKKLPALARSVGESLGEFKKARKHYDDEGDDVAARPDTTTPAAKPAAKSDHLS